MIAASIIRLQVEAALAQRIPSALTPQKKMIRPVVATGIERLDQLLQGGLPVGALTEIVGPECSGRTSVALSFLGRLTGTDANKLCAWIDVSNALDPASAAAMGVDLKRLLWVRCRNTQQTARCTDPHFALPEKYLVPPLVKKGLHGGGHGPHPRSEAKGMAASVGTLMCSEPIAPRCAEAQRRPMPAHQNNSDAKLLPAIRKVQTQHRPQHFDAMERGLRCADLLIQTGGFSAIVLDLSGIAPEYVSRIELSAWHRYRAGAEKTQSSIVLLTQYPCAKSSSELQLRLSPAEPVADEFVLSGMGLHVEVLRQRHMSEEDGAASLRKPPQNVRTAHWRSRTHWTGQR